MTAATETLTSSEVELVLKLVDRQWLRLDRDRGTVDPLSPLYRDLLKQQGQLETVQQKLIARLRAEAVADL